MIVEHGILNIRSGQSAAFEAALRQALPLIAATEGFLGIEVRPCIETPDRYLLLVRWTTLEAHTIGFRASDRYPKWRALLHHFYDPAPVIEHYGEPVAKA
jgi:heme-degrading monooxygenase HmoA